MRFRPLRIALLALLLAAGPARAIDPPYQAEMERVQKTQYEIQLRKNREVVEEMRIEAENQAEKSFQRLSSSAKQKAKTP